jgi:hypothetical protein
MVNSNTIVEKKAAQFPGFFYPAFFVFIFEKVNGTIAISTKFSILYIAGIVVSYVILWFLTKPWFEQLEDISTLASDPKDYPKVFFRTFLRTSVPLLSSFFAIIVFGFLFDIKLPQINWWVLLIALVFQLSASRTGIAKYFNRVPNKL